jgi:hypothetical protein
MMGATLGGVVFDAFGPIQSQPRRHRADDARRLIQKAAASPENLWLLDSIFRLRRSRTVAKGEVRGKAHSIHATG